MAKMFNRARMTVTSTGTGPLSLGVAVAGYQTFSSAGAQNGDSVSYAVEDGLKWEIGTGTYNSVAGTLSRTVTQSFDGTTYGTSPISVTTSAQVFISPLAADLQYGTSAGNLVQLDGSARLPAVDGSLLTNVPVTATNFTGTLPVSKGGTGVTTSTGTGSVVFSTSPTLVTPVLGTPASGNLANCTFPTLNQNTTGTAAGLSSTLVVGSGGTGTGTAFTAGSVVFAGTSGVYSQDNSQLFWNTTTKRLGIGSSNPGGAIGDERVRITGTDTDGWPLAIEDSAGTVASGFYAANNVAGVGNFSADPFIFLTQNTEKMRLDASGDLRILGAGSSGSPAVSFSGSAASNSLVLNASGNLGIGTTGSFARKLTVFGAADSQVTVGNTSPSISLTNDVTSPNGASQTYLWALATSVASYGLPNSGDCMIGGIGNSRGDLYLNPNYYGTGIKNVILCPNSGNVGIGTTGSPSALLQVRKDQAAQTQLFITNATNNVNAYAVLGLTNDAVVSNIAMSSTAAGGIFSIYNAANGPMRFFTNAQPRMTLDASGNLLVNTTDAGSQVNFKNTVSNNTKNSIYIQNSNGTEQFRIYGDGGFATGTDAFSPYNYTSASSANVVVNSGGVLLRSTSSRRYKNNIHDAVHGLADVQNLRSVTYNGVNDGDKVFGGLIAEEVDAAGLTEFVVYDGEGRPDALHYGNMAGLFVKAIQELAAKVQALEAKVA